MKKLMVLTLALVLTLSLAACGKKDEPAPVATAAPAPVSTEAPAPAPVSTKAPEVAPAPEAAAPEAAAPEAAPEEAAATDEVVYTMDYDTIAAWVDQGYIGIDESGAPVVMAIDAAAEKAVIIFGDNSDMTAASFAGLITFTDTTGTITDEANGASLTFGAVQTDDETIELDMGDIGKATIKLAATEKVLETIKIAIDNYKHLA